LYPGIVIGAVEDHDSGIGDFADDAGRRFEEVRVLTRIAQNAQDRNAASTDLPRNIAIEILRRDNSDIGVTRDCAKCQRERSFRLQPRFA
jgi:hypothetical protein